MMRDNLQFYEDGFDFPRRRWTYALPDDAADARHSISGLPEDVDVLVVGTGPAGLLLAAQLARFPQIRTCVIEAKPQRLQLGQADGLQCRTLEIFEAFGFCERVLREAYWVNEVTFWGPDGGSGLMRTGRTKDTKEGISEFPHVLLNQARIHDFFLDDMSKSERPLVPYYSKRLVDLRPVENGQGSVASVEYLDDANQGRTASIKARYVVGCDGARSKVRGLMGMPLQGDAANHAWGVMDVLVDTDFPDIRFKGMVKSKSEGVLMIIPREGGYLVRLYVEMGTLDQGERVAARHMQLADVVGKAQKIFAPFRFDVKECPWWSVYEIGQRLTDHFDDRHSTPDGLPSTFIVGDACHTHSPKAGQGMNVSMSDAFNLGWKLVTVLLGSAKPELLKTYSDERQSIAKELIEFDRYWSGALIKDTASDDSKTNGDDATKPNGTNDTNGVNGINGTNGTAKEDHSAAKEDKDATIQKLYEKSELFVTGLATRYPTSSITADDSKCPQHLAKGYPIGKRFKSCEVLRCFDARVLHLAHAMGADARWRILIFDASPHPTAADGKTARLCEWLTHDARSPVVRATPEGADLDAVIDVRAVFHVDHFEVQITDVPEILKPRKGRYRIEDHEKVYADRWTGGAAIPSIYKEHEIDTDEGCVIIVRPDQYVAAVWRLEAYANIAGFFDGVLNK